MFDLPSTAPANTNPRLPKDEARSMVAKRECLMKRLTKGGFNSYALGILWRDIRVIDDCLNNLPAMRRYG
jgi:hypothetical protein